jgi:hypothetical protein
VAASVKSELHRLIDDMNDEQATRLLEIVTNPLERDLLFAPFDDEPVTEDDLKAIRDGEAAYRRGEWVADDNLAL